MWNRFTRLLEHSLVLVNGSAVPETELTTIFDKIVKRAQDVSVWSSQAASCLPVIETESQRGNCTFDESWSRHKIHRQSVRKSDRLFGQQPNWTWILQADCWCSCCSGAQVRPRPLKPHCFLHIMSLYCQIHGRISKINSSQHFKLQENTINLWKWMWWRSLI